MIHQPAGGVSGQISDIEIQANEILRYRTLLNEILAETCGKTAADIARDSDRDFFLSAQEAKDYGLVDEILSKPTEAAEAAAAAAAPNSN
jgi:ATP-dependent Clp protease protease subunit